MPKATGRHPDKKLTAVRVNALRKAGRYADGNGLYLVVSATGAKSWLLRIVVQGRRQDIGLGSTRLVTLAEAREEALRLRRIARAGGDPLLERQRQSRLTLTFEEATERVHSDHQGSWKNPKHAAQWISSLRAYAFPYLGRRPVDQIQAADLLNVLSPIWLTKPETARRVRQRIGTVLDWARAAGLREGENPAVGIARGLPKQPAKNNHHLALPYAQVPRFLAQLQASNNGEIVKLAIAFLILTAARTGEVIGARWDEIDEAEGIWTVPAIRMKAGREHRVPLSPPCMEILRQAKRLGSGEPFIFPGASADKPLSNMAFLMAVRRMNLSVTVHGFRSAFRDWASEQTSFPHEICEMALAHTIRNKVEAAYRRGDLLEKRRKLMETWAAYCCWQPEQTERSA